MYTWQREKMTGKYAAREFIRALRELMDYLEKNNLIKPLQKELGIYNENH